MPHLMTVAGGLRLELRKQDSNSCMIPVSSTSNILCRSGFAPNISTFVNPDVSNVLLMVFDLCLSKRLPIPPLHKFNNENNKKFLCFYALEWIERFELSLSVWKTDVLTVKHYIHI